VTVPERTSRGAAWSGGRKKRGRTAAREQMTALVDAMKEATGRRRDDPGAGDRPLMMNPQRWRGRSAESAGAEPAGRGAADQAGEMELRRRTVELDERKMQVALDREQKRWSCCGRKRHDGRAADR